MSLPVSGDVPQTVTPWGGAYTLYGGCCRNFGYSKNNIKRHHKVKTDHKDNIVSV